MRSAASGRHVVVPAPVPHAHTQPDHQVRLEWGPTGAMALARAVDVAVVVDVLSFTTTVTVAVDRGITFFPYRWGDEGAGERWGPDTSVPVGSCPHPSSLVPFVSFV